MVTIGFDRSTAYSFSEDAGFVNLGVQVQSGSIAEGVSIPIDFSTEDGEAVGKEMDPSVCVSL